MKTIEFMYSLLISSSLFVGQGHMVQGFKTFTWKVLLSEIIWRLQVQSQLQTRITRNIYYNLTLVLIYG